jgi:signal transduction histidine kinase
MPEGHLPVVSYLGVPIISRSGQILGALLFSHTQENVFTERHERIVEGLAAQTAIAMDNAELYNDAQKERARAEQSAAENERLYLNAEEANRLKDEFLATVSHELRTPLNAILGWANLLQAGDIDDESKARAFETIYRNAKSQAHIIDDILDVSRIITGKLRLELNPIYLFSIIETTVESLRQPLRLKL